MLQQGAEIGATVGGTHHDLCGGIKEPYLEGSLKVDRAVGTQKQNGTGSLGTGLAQHVGQAHVSKGERCRQTGLQLGISPAGLPQIDAVEGQTKGQEALKTGLPQGAKSTDQDGGRAQAIGGMGTQRPGAPGSEIILHTGGDGAVAGGVAHAKQGKTRGDLIIVEEALIRLVDTTAHNFACAGATSTGPTGVGEVNALLLSSIEDVGVRSAGKSLTVFRFDGEGVSHGSLRAKSISIQD
jgi:hypothetical protein